jgi:uroporphyrinogen-III decarboxylase
MTPWERFVAVARGNSIDQIPVAFIVDSPWLPSYAGISTLDYFLRDDEWLRINLQLLNRFPDVLWVPGFWVEYGMAAEPSALGARTVWHAAEPPSIEPLRGGLSELANLQPADPQLHGLMPFVLQRYLDAEKRLLPEGMNIQMVAARGPLAIAGWLVGFSDLMLALKTEPVLIHRALQVVTETIIRWLHAQWDVLRAPQAILVLDDIVGMLSPKMFEEFVRPYFSRIFAEFPNALRVYHNDTPCPRLLASIGSLDFHVWNFSHLMDMGDVHAAMPKMALMGNVPPVEVMVRGTPEQAETWARECVRKTDGHGLILSAGGGVNGGTAPEMIDAIVRAAKR